MTAEMKNHRCVTHHYAYDCRSRDAETPNKNMNATQMEPERQKQVNEWLDVLHDAAQRSYDTCRQLRDRLNPVMRKELTESTEPATPELALVDVAHAIREAVKVLDATAENHREMLRLLEV